MDEGKFGQWSEDELLRQIEGIDAVASLVYRMGISLNNTRLTHMAGIIGEYAKMCKVSMDKGHCFMDASGLFAEPHQIEYLSEKIGVVFGSVFSTEEAKRVLLRELP